MSDQLPVVSRVQGRDRARPRSRAVGASLRRWRVGLGALCALLLLWGGLGSAFAQVQVPGATPVQIHAVERLDADGRWRALTLPAQWTAGQAEDMHLRARVQLGQAPTGLWAIRFDRLPPEHDLRLNGQRVSGLPLGQQAALPRSVLSQWITVPPSLLHAGENLIELDVALHGYPGGVSAPTLGPGEQLLPAHRRYRLLTEVLPHSLNLAVAGLAVFTLAVWWLRRAEQLMGFFGVLMLVVSLRNLGYYSADPLAPPPLGTWLFFSVQGLTSALLLGFAQVQTTPGPHRRLLATLGGAWGVFVLLGAVAAWGGWLAGLRSWVYPPLIALNLHSAWRLWLAAESLSARWRRALVIGGALLLACGIHDYLFNAAWLPVGDVFWLPYVTPLLMVVVDWLLLRRLVTALDFAERQGQELERRVLERTRDLQAANAAKTRFVAAASHDLRQPVAAIGLLTGLLREQPQLEGPSRTLLDRLGASVQALERLLRGLLDLSRFDAGSVEVRPRRMPLQALFDAVAAHEGGEAERKGLSLRWRGGHLAVHSDPVLLEQIVRNLVNNALRYTERGGVLVSARRAGTDGVWLQVRDTGYGIPPERQAQVFEEFVQLDNPAREAARGLGLGLSLVRRAAELLEAPLSLWSRPGRGSCFTLRLPLGADVHRVPARPGPGPMSLAGRRLLVVDDDEGLRESLRLRLEGWGATVQAHASVQALGRALARAGAVPRPELLITDQRLPDGDSRDVVAALAAQHAGVPVLVITGDTAPADLARLDALGWPVLHKPFDGDALFAALQACWVAERRARAAR